jgi:hypothetical protein
MNAFFEIKKSSVLTEVEKIFFHYRINYKAFESNFVSLYELKEI